MRCQLPINCLLSIVNCFWGTQKPVVAGMTGSVQKHAKVAEMCCWQGFWQTNKKLDLTKECVNKNKQLAKS